MTTTLRELPKIRDSLSYAYIEHARLEKEDAAVVAYEKAGGTHLPCAALAAIFLGPGTSVTHAAMKVMTEAGCSVIWVGEGMTRVYAQGMGETRSSRRFLSQVECWAATERRAAVVLRMYEYRFGERLPAGISMAQVRGREGGRVRAAYQRLAAEHGITWSGRSYRRGNWSDADAVNQALSGAASCLYGVCHAAIVSAGYSTALGFLHTGKLLSFVYDVADLYRTEVVVPAAFEVARRFVGATSLGGLSRDVRISCREAFRKARLLDRIVADVDGLLALDDGAIEAAAGLVDGLVEEPGGLWDPEADGGVTAGGINHGSDDL